MDDIAVVRYFTGTAVVIALVLLMPPYRERHWLSRFTSRRDYD